MPHLEIPSPFQPEQVIQKEKITCFSFSLILVKTSVKETPYYFFFLGTKRNSHISLKMIGKNWKQCPRLK